MTFLHLGLVTAALPLALLPVLLHLLTLQRLKTVELSTYRFLFDSYVQQRRRMQFLEALLAFLRTLFLLVLILALGRPVARHWDRLFQAAAGSGREVVFLIDGSASMNAVSRGESALRRAQTAAKTVLARLGRDDRLTVLKVASRPEEVVGRAAVEVGPQADKIDAVAASPGRANFFAALTEVFGSEARRPVNPVVYVFTDAQASGWKEVRSQGLGSLLPPECPVVVVDTGAREPGVNLSVVGDPPPRQRAVVGLPVALTARVVNQSAEPAEGTLSVLLDGKEVRRVPVALKPNEVVVRREVLEPAEPGSPRVRFEVTGKSPDPFPDDNRYEFALPVAPKVPVVVVDGGPSPDPFADAALYLRVALSATDRDADDAPAGKPAAKPVSAADARSLDVRVVPEPALTPDAVRDAGVVILADCGQLNGQHFAWLRDFVAGGGGLLVLPGGRVNPAAYNTQFFPVPGPLGESVTAATLGPQPAGDPERPETFERLAEVDYAHPVLSVFDDRDAQFFRQVRFKKRWPLALPPKRGNALPLARFADGAPALVESRLGDGLVVLAAFPADAAWSNFPSQCAREFVPLVLRLVGHLRRRPEVDAPAVVPAGAVAEFTAAASWAPLAGEVASPSGGKVELAFERSAGRYVAAYDRTTERGFYTAEVRGARPDQRRGDVAFAVNLSPDESDPKSLGEADFAGMLPGAKLTVVDASAEEAQQFGEVGSETEVWRQMIWFLFAVIGAEFLLATLGGSRRSAAGEDEPAAGRRVAAYNPTSLVSRMTGGG